MKRYTRMLSGICFMVAPVVASAERFEIETIPDAITLFPEEAQIIRRASIDLPAGRHELVISDLDQETILENVEVKLSGASILARSWDDRPSLHDRTEGPARMAAKQALLEAETELARLQDQIARAEAEIETANAQLRFFEQHNIPDWHLPDPDQLDAVAEIMQKGDARARAIILASRIEIREFERLRPDLERMVRRAQAALNAMPEELEFGEFTITVIADQAVQVELELSYFSDARWAPIYEINLITGDEAEPEIQMLRNAALVQNSGEDLENVLVTLSNFDTKQRNAPTFLYSRPLELLEPQATERNASGSALSRSSEDIAAEYFEEPSIEPVLVEAVRPSNRVALRAGSGPIVTYQLPERVSLREGVALLASLGEVSFQAELSAEVRPRLSEFAYRKASFLNDSGERLLSGSALLKIDGQIIGSHELEGFLPGAMEEIYFGPVFGVTAKRVVLDRNEGDRGIISRSNERAEAARIDVENLTEQEWPVRVIDQRDFSEQEALEIIWRAQPSPDQDSYEDRRGIVAWDMNLAPGEKQTITIEQFIRWPEGKEIR